MAQHFRAISWNCRRASTQSPAWDYLLRLNPDIALLQEVTAIPPRILDVYQHAKDFPVTPSGKRQKFSTTLMVKGVIEDDLPLPSPNDWVTRELDFFRGNFIARQIKLHTGFRLKAISVYSPAFPVDPGRLEGTDTTGIQLTQNRWVWGTEILWASLKTMGIDRDEAFIVAGDFNSSETFDYLWSGGPRGNREIQERMNAIGLWECLKIFKGELTPTFRTPRGGHIIHQMDHMYVTQPLMEGLTSCDVGSASDVFDATPSLSDHLPIIADFSILARQVRPG